MAREIDFDQVTTRGGDSGEAGLFDGERRAKDDPVFEALGELDELSSWIGVVRARHRDEWSGPLRDLDSELYDAQRVTSRIAALVACSPTATQYARLEQVDDATVAELELREKRALQSTTIEPVFIVPGEHLGAAEIDYARALCRRCERRLVSVIRSSVRPRPDLHACQRYLNRLSDYLFVVGRQVEQASE
ncbi:MAG: ATP:cob(I)alamin adenosyltransferase [Spirochaetota bacterium]